MMAVAAVVDDGFNRRAVDHIHAADALWRHVVPASASQQMEEFFTRIREHRESLCGGVGYASFFQ